MRDKIIAKEEFVDIITVQDVVQTAHDYGFFNNIEVTDKHGNDLTPEDFPTTKDVHIYNSIHYDTAQGAIPVLSSKTKQILGDDIKELGYD
jgi:hypothetical protein